MKNLLWVIVDHTCLNHLRAQRVNDWHVWIYDHPQQIFQNSDLLLFSLLIIVFFTKYSVFCPGFFFWRRVMNWANLTNFGVVRFGASAFLKLMADRHSRVYFRQMLALGQLSWISLQYLKLNRKTMFINYLRVFKRCENA